MSIDLVFNSTGRPPDWNAEEVRKLEEAVEILRRRYDLDVDRPAERHYLWFAIGGLHSVLYGATGNAKYLEHPSEPNPDQINPEFGLERNPGAAQLFGRT